jgi:hypothetical protein
VGASGVAKECGPGVRDRTHRLRQFGLRHPKVCHHSQSRNLVLVKRNQKQVSVTTQAKCRSKNEKSGCAQPRSSALM